MAIGAQIGARVGAYVGARVGAVRGGTAPSTTTQTISLADSADPVNGAANFNYIAQYTNTGAIDATTVSVAVTLDAKLTYVSASGTGWSCSQSGGVVTCTRATAVPGAAPAITIGVTAPNDGTTSTTSTAQATASNAANANGSQDTTITPQTTQTVAVTDSADPVITGGDAFAYTVQYTNTGAAPATSVSVVVTLDASLAYVSASGTGWTIGQSGQVVTCTRATAVVGAAPAITINVTTGTSAVSASTAAQATASNAPTANGSQGTTVQLVSKDATAGIYVPASSTEWTNFIARKGLAVSAPTGLWLLQEASGNAADSSGNGLTLTATGGLTYAQAQAGWSRNFIKTVDGTSAALTTTSASLPDPATTSYLLISYAIVTANGGSVRSFMQTGSVSGSFIGVTTVGKMRVTSSTFSDSTAVTTGSVRPYVIRTNRTAVTVTGYNDAEKLSPTAASVTTKKVVLAGAYAGQMGYSVLFTGADAEISDANLKALLQALGWTITWT